MSTTPTTQAQPANERKPKKRPEVKFGRVAVWLNTVDTPDGIRMFRSVTISPSRYKDGNGQWQDSKGFRPEEIGSIVVSLQKALDFTLTEPIQGPEHEDEHAESIPF